MAARISNTRVREGNKKVEFKNDDVVNQHYFYWSLTLTAENKLLGQ